jgi:sulfate adenylyltransferase
MTGLIEPHGGTLCECYAKEQEREALKGQSAAWPSWDLTPRQLCDVELLLNGGFSPLRGFMQQADYQTCLQTMRLANGLLWPIPIVLDVSAQFASGLTVGDRIALRDPEGLLIACLAVGELWTPDKEQEAALVFGTKDPFHPGVAHLLERSGAVYIGGELIGIEPPPHYDFTPHRHSPAALRALFQQRGWRRVVAFQTRNPMHRAHQELTFRAAKQAQANLLLHPVVGMTKPGDIDHFTRVRCYEHLLETYPEQTTMLSLLPLAMRMAGPREALWHAIIRKNFGATHFIVGRDHAGPGKDKSGKPFYGPYDAQTLVEQHQAELGMVMVPFQQLVYVPELDQYLPQNEVPPGHTTLDISGTELRRRLHEGAEIPAWFSFPKIVQELRRSYPPRSRQGFTVFMTGLSGAGKSTIANALQIKLMELGGRRVTLLDGDLVRKHLSSELGFSKEHRDLNIRRIGYVASEITKHGGIALCAPIAPYRATRTAVREMIEPWGGFIEIHVATSIEVCEQRDRKGLYAKARQGLIQGFTGIDDPYEAPENPELRIDTALCTVAEAAQSILLCLESLGFIAAIN